MKAPNARISAKRRFLSLRSPTSRDFFTRPFRYQPGSPKDQRQCLAISESRLSDCNSKGTSLQLCPPTILDLPPQPSDETAKSFHVFPQIADGGGWQSALIVTNASQSTSLCTLELHGLTTDRFEDIGTTATGSTATFSLIAPVGYLVWPTRNESALASGYATLDCTDAVVAQVLYASKDGADTTTGISTVFSSQVGGDFQVPVLTPEATLGFAIANDTNSEAFCRTVLQDPQRVNLGEGTLPVPPKSNVARFLHEVIPIPGGFTRGSATVSCDQPVAMTGLHFELRPDGSIITFNTLPPAVLDTSPEPIISERVALEALTVRAVVLTGQTAPGMNGALFKTLGRPSINSSGVVAFKASVTAIPVSYGALTGKIIPSGIFLAVGDSISRIVSSGDAVPSRSLSFFSDFGSPVLNDGGHVAFSARIGTGYDNLGVFIQTGRALVPIAFTGDPAPGTDGSFATLGRYGLALNNEGNVAFEATFDGREPGDGIFMYSNGELTALVLRGQPVPGGRGESFDHFSGLVMNEASEVAFAASVRAERGGTTSSGIFVGVGGRLRTVALEGQPAPYFDGGVFGSLREPAINDFGEVVFVDGVMKRQPRGPAYFSSTGVFAATSNSTLALAGAGPHKRPDDLAITGNIRRPTITRLSDGTNVVLFTAWDEVRGRDTLWLFSQDTLTARLKEGDATVVGGAYSSVSSPVLSTAGHFAFLSRLKGSSVKAGIFVSGIGFEGGYQ